MGLKRVQSWLTGICRAGLVNAFVCHLFVCFNLNVCFKFQLVLAPDFKPFVLDLETILASFFCSPPSCIIFLLLLLPHRGHPMNNVTYSWRLQFHFPLPSILFYQFPEFSRSSCTTTLLAASTVFYSLPQKKAWIFPKSVLSQAGEQCLFLTPGVKAWKPWWQNTLYYIYYTNRAICTQPGETEVQLIKLLAHLHTFFLKDLCYG